MHVPAKFGLIISAILLAFILGAACATRPVLAPGSGTAKPSFAFDNYTNDELGFSIQYPKSWIVADAAAPYCIFRVEGKQKLPSMSISVFDSDKVKEQLQEIYDYYKLTNIQTIEQKEFVLSDGQTKSLYTITRMTHPQAQLIGYSIIFQRNGKLVAISITTMSGVEDTPFFNAIFQTLMFNK